MEFDNILPIPQFDISQRINLSNIVKENNISDQTNLIRNLKHSVILQTESKNMINILKKYTLPLTDKQELEQARLECSIEAPMLFSCYTDIFNKFLKSEIDIKIFNTFLSVLKDIEEEKVSQHEASVVIGTILKELYIDSALKKSDKMDKLYNTNEKSPTEPRKTLEINWKDFKQLSNSKFKR